MSLDATESIRVPDASQLRVLIVDDDVLDLSAIRRCLMQSGVAVSVDEATTAADARAVIRPSAFDCVILDYYMPGIDNVSLLRSIREVASDMPVIILTGHGDEQIAVDFMKAGAQDYLLKASMTPERLATTCRHAVQMARAAAAQRDITRRLREREAEFRALANSIPQMAWIADADGRRYWYNERWYEFTGLRPDQSLGLGWRLALHSDHRVRAYDVQAAATARSEPWEYTAPLRRNDGTYRWFLVRAMPFRSGDGKATRWFGTNTDITERLDTERALSENAAKLRASLALEQSARGEAERATRVRDDVLAIVAHDLRNPIHTITLCAEALLGQTAESDGRRHSIGVIKRCTKTMERLIADLLDVARLEAGTLSVLREPVELPPLIIDTLEQFEVEGLARKVTIRSEIQAGLPVVVCERERLMQVLSNLLGNALKFTPEGRKITVQVMMAGDAVRISVEDAGSGIAEADLPHIFDRYWQASRGSAGAGLGLAICKGIVEAYGGRIWATSTVGRGTTVSFTLPCGPPAASP
jgi:PAS domain S-box-containing protein